VVYAVDDALMEIVASRDALATRLGMDKETVGSDAGGKEGTRSVPRRGVVPVSHGRRSGGRGARC